MKRPHSEVRNPRRRQSPGSETRTDEGAGVWDCLSAIPHPAQADGGLPPRWAGWSQSVAQTAHSKTWRKLLASCLVSAFCLSTAAQYSIPWHTIDGGGGTSTGGVFTVSGTIGQPDARGPLTNGQFSVTGGFWAMPTLVQTPDAPTLHITNAAPGWATIWWTPPSGTNWILQESPSLTTDTWTHSPSGWTNPVTVPATWPSKFYRLFKP